MVDYNDFFYNKELSDAIRDIILNSASSIECAIIYMRSSNDYKRDSFIVKKLANAGMEFATIANVIKAINIK